MMFILLFVNFFEIRVFDLRNEYISSLLENNIISIVFVVLCFLVLINGSNFIDGLNGLQIGYYLIILIILLKNGFLNFTYINNIEVIYLIIILFYLLVLNFNEKLFLGDSGSYTLSLFTGYFLVLVYNNNQNISPFFIALLLWYPCFENLFSILRKFTFNKSPLKPDNKHLHQLIYIYLKIQFKIKKNLANNISSIMINSFNLIFISIASLHYKHTFIQLVMILLFSLIYIYLYIRILKIISKKS